MNAPRTSLTPADYTSYNKIMNIIGDLVLSATHAYESSQKYDITQEKYRKVAEMFCSNHKLLEKFNFNNV